MENIIGRLIGFGIAIFTAAIFVFLTKDSIVTQIDAVIVAGMVCILIGFGVLFIIPSKNHIDIKSEEREE